MRRIAQAIEDFREVHGSYLPADSIEKLESLLPPGTHLPPLDAWGTPFRIVSQPDRYFVISLGQCGRPEFAKPEDYSKTKTEDLTDDLVLSNKGWIRWPEGQQKN